MEVVLPPSRYWNFSSSDGAIDLGDSEATGAGRVGGAEGGWCASYPEVVCEGRES